MPENIDIHVTIGDHAQAENSNIGNVNITVCQKSIKDLLHDSYIELVSEVNDFSDATLKRNFLILLDRYNEIFDNNTSLLETILSQINCKIQKPQEDNKLSIIKLLSFLVIATNIGDTLVLPDMGNADTYICINGKKNWLFNAAQLSEISLEKHISKIAEYIARTPTVNINNGNCFITLLAHNTYLNCGSCNKGLIEKDCVNIITDLISTNKQWQQDFFELSIEKKITFRCGKCSTNITQFEPAKSILGGI